MIRSFTVDGYKGMVGSRVVFNESGLTVLIGPNGSGKSTILEAVQATCELAAAPMQQTRFDPSRMGRIAHGGDSGRKVSFLVEVPPPGSPDGARTPLKWELTLRSGQVLRETVTGAAGAVVLDSRPDGLNRWSSAPYLASHWPDHSSPPPGWYHDARAVADAVGPARIVRFLPTRIAEPCPAATSTVEPDGYGLPAALLRLLTSDRRQFLALQTRFAELFPWVDEILPELDLESTGKAGDTSVCLRLRERGSRHPFDAGEVSSGMLQGLALLWVTMRSEPDRILCFEEPENSMHPYLLREVYDLLGMAARGEMVRTAEGEPAGTRVQVIVATHSVDFANLCGPEEVRICERDEGGIVRTHAVEKGADLDQALKAFDGALGELWYSGALGGIPRNGPAARVGRG